MTGLDDLFDNRSLIADRCLNALEQRDLTLAYGYARTLINQCVMKNNEAEDRKILKALDLIYDDVGNLSQIKDLIPSTNFKFKDHGIMIGLSVLEFLYHTGLRDGMELSDSVRNKRPRVKYKFKAVVEVVNDFRTFIFEVVNSTASRNKFELPKPTITQNKDVI